MKRLLRTAIPLAIAGTALVGLTTPAHAGTWIYTNALYPTKAICNSRGPATAAQYGASAWICEFYTRGLIKNGGWDVKVFIN